ncbi:MAG: Aspartyl/glutamyl-tRNA(Asn/Gln) amidotransferase subunit C [Opitutia bacterium UBA7350]|nr:MAG: Aspartyl/glutamyl-tRNA(Asn/Gln) amidotransferase subunit C [Opitutae bacterium UBA7350]
MTDKAHLDIEYVSQLARLDLSAAEKEKLGSQLAAILEHFDALKAVDVSGVEPTAHAHAVENVWREGDRAGPVYDPEVLSSMAPESRDNQVVVPKVVE